MTIMDQERMVTMADWMPGPPQGSWTYEAYAALPDDGQRYEIVQGVLMMSPAPEPSHQGIAGEIYRYLCLQILDKGRGLVFTSPIDVVLSASTTTQPDVVALLKEHLDRLQKKYIMGAPDLVVEVISPGSKTYDRLVKYGVYEKAGVPEYWLVNASEQTIEIFLLESGAYRSAGLFRGEQLPVSRMVPDITITVGQIFDWSHGLL
jgi:Uma2 family endonuclease